MLFNRNRIYLSLPSAVRTSDFALPLRVGTDTHESLQLCMPQCTLNATWVSVPSRFRLTKLRVPLQQKYLNMPDLEQIQENCPPLWKRSLLLYPSTGGWRTHPQPTKGLLVWFHVKNISAPSPLSLSSHYLFNQIRIEFTRRIYCFGALDYLVNSNKWN